VGKAFTVASWNVHAGIDGWGRIFDVSLAVADLDADFTVLLEAFEPDQGLAFMETLGQALAEEYYFCALGSGRRQGPDPRAGRRWMTRHRLRPFAHGLYLDGALPLPEKIQKRELFEKAQAGQLGIGLLSRYPLSHVEEFTLGRLPRDRINRKVLVASVAMPDGPLRFVAVHMTHLSYGSPRHYRALGRYLKETASETPTVILGDFNLWGWPVVGFLRGFRRAVKGRSWPAWRPHSQIDHLLVDKKLEVLSGSVAKDRGSDHRAIRATLHRPT